MKLTKVCGSWVPSWGVERRRPGGESNQCPNGGVSNGTAVMKRGHERATGVGNSAHGDRIDLCNPPQMESGADDLGFVR
jgi:hypothetical protein